MPASHGRAVKFAYFHCVACDEFKAYSDYIDQVPTWRCDCGDLATFLGWGKGGKPAYEKAKRSRELRREASKHSEDQRMKDEDRRVSRLAASVLDGLRSTIVVAHCGLKSQTSNDRFDRLVCDGLRRMIADE